MLNPYEIVLSTTQRDAIFQLVYINIKVEENTKLIIGPLNESSVNTSKNNFLQLAYMITM